MWIGVGKLVLDFYNNDKAAIKNRKLEELSNDLRKVFNISVSEVSDFEEPERCVLGFAVVMPDTWNEKSAHSFIEKICETVDKTAFARVTLEDTDLYQH